MGEVVAAPTTMKSSRARAPVAANKKLNTHNKPAQTARYFRIVDPRRLAMILSRGRCWLQREKMACLGSESLSDLEKLQQVVARYPSVDAVVGPIEAFAARLTADLETQSLLRTIAQDERSSTSFLIDACTQLSGRA